MFIVTVLSFIMSEINVQASFFITNNYYKAANTP